MATQARVVLKIPARIVGAGNIQVSLENGVYTISDGGVLVTTVADLPPATGRTGARRYVTDSTSTIFSGIVVGGGSSMVPVWSDGTRWRIG